MVDLRAGLTELQTHSLGEMGATSEFFWYHASVGGTLPFIALRRGFDAIGIERDRTAVESTDTFLAGFLRESGIRYQRKAEWTGGGRRSIFTIPIATSVRPLPAWHAVAAS